MYKKVDYKKDYKALYLPKKAPTIIDVPAMSYAMIHGTGDPNGEDFAEATAALYSLSYAVKMSYKGKEIPKDYYEYTVFPLEGIWDLVDKTKSINDKGNYKYTIMIRQPDFLTQEFFTKFLEICKKKKPNGFLERIILGEVTDGLSCQMMHIGSYDDEPASFAKMEEYCQDNGYRRKSKTHREIYLSDPRKTAVEKLKTVLRFSIEAI
ncbi:hypothetical protein SAMN05660297_02088 [Natronincola peptidivorans]|uniref:GyrI-like small molecule binding domain-containing protein n=1 Tax=Natronincola peptidivorans TaxID=426128 RepID=A0A1I0DNP1_9FIRM|nr:GyrI-like domain-containing protein [Natronincola peptidivorans]SET33966.1 hypothetical protein SAMN05660297_02088 [Natronincola peptidivorans]